MILTLSNLTLNSVGCVFKVTAKGNDEYFPEFPPPPFYKKLTIFSSLISFSSIEKMQETNGFLEVCLVLNSYMDRAVF